MSDNFDMTTIIFALLAVFVLFKLRSVLGTRTGNERPPIDPYARPKHQDHDMKSSSETDNVVRLPGSTPTSSNAGENLSMGNRWEKLADAKAWQGLNEISAADRTFDAQMFLSGSKSAYEMIVLAFASGDKKTLQELLANDVYDGFQSVIAKRESRKEKTETTFVSIEKAFIDDAQFKNKIVQITVRFVSKLITTTRDIENNVIDGNADKVVEITDVWTFSRDANSRDPNWKLIATETDHR